jgi:hypothetical protein
LKEPPKRKSVTFEELSYFNMLTLNALVELLTEKGVLSKAEILGENLRGRLKERNWRPDHATAV